MNRLKITGAVAIGLTLFTYTYSNGNDSETKANVVAPELAVAKLVEGNKRFYSDKPQKPHQTAEWRKQVAKGQHPFAVVIACSDSRVAPEIVFDQGLGDLFVVRVAGNTVDKVALGSIEYAVEHLGARLIAVVGHKRCGAVTAAMDGHELPGSLPWLTKPIEPAVHKVKGHEGDPLENAIKENVRTVRDYLGDTDSLFKELFNKRELQIVGFEYDLDSGVAHPVK